jgi:hypothetical protein
MIFYTVVFLNPPQSLLLSGDRIFVQLCSAIKVVELLNEKRTKSHGEVVKVFSTT